VAVCLERRQGYPAIRSGYCQAFECELGGDPLKCVGFGYGWFIGVESEKPPIALVSEGSPFRRVSHEFRGIENVTGPCQVSGADFRHRLFTFLWRTRRRFSRAFSIRTGSQILDVTMRRMG